MLTSSQAVLVQESFALIAPIGEDVAALFYARLFEIDPSLEAMFPKSIETQGQRLMQVLTTAVRGVDDLDGFLPFLRELGRRHVGYGVRDEHYETVAEALLWTLQIGLHAGFTSEVHEAWTTWYWLLADAMKVGAADELLATSA